MGYQWSCRYPRGASFLSLPPLAWPWNLTLKSIKGGTESNTNSMPIENDGPLGTGVLTSLGTEGGSFATLLLIAQTWQESLEVSWAMICIDSADACVHS
jgi:hypothetical protein